MKRQQSNDNITSLYQQFQTHNKVKNLASDIDEHSIVERIKPTSNRLTKNKRRI